MNRCHTKAEARRLILAKLDELLAERGEVTSREDKDINHEVRRFKHRLERDVRSLVNNRDYAVKGQAQ